MIEFHVTRPRLWLGLFFQPVSQNGSEHRFKIAQAAAIYRQAFTNDDHESNSNNVKRL